MKLQEKPSRILLLLLHSPGQVVTRDTLRKELWAEDTFVEFDAGLNTAVSKLRTALGDSSANPMFVERVPKVGYRFIAPVQVPQLAAVTAAATAGMMRTPPRKRVRAGLAAVIGLVGLILAGWRIGASPWSVNRPATARLTIELPADQTLSLSYGRAVAISANGRSLAYIAERGGQRQIFAKRMEESEFHAIPGTVSAVDLSFSPDGGSLIFCDGGRIMRIGLDGRDAAQIAPYASTCGSGIWASDGTLYLEGLKGRASGAQESFEVLVNRFRPGHSTPELVTAPSSTDQRWFYAQQLLPGGQSLLVSEAWGPRDRAVMAHSLRDGTEKVLAEPAMGGFYLSSGHLVYAWRGNLLATPFRLGEMRALAPGVVVAPGVAPNGWAGVQASISETGTLAYIPGPGADRVLVWVDRAGHEAPLGLPPAAYDLLSLSPSGRHMLLSRNEPAANWIWDYDMARSKWTRVASGEWTTTSGAWSPDESTVAFTANLQGERFENLYLKKMAGDEPPERLSPSPNGQFVQSWTARDGLVYTESDRPETHIDLLTIFPEGGRKPAPLVTTKGNDSHGTFSPDGKWLAYTSSVSGALEVYVQERAGGPAVRVSRAGGQGPIWVPRGTELFYRTEDGVWSVEFPNGAPAAPTLLLRGRYVMPGIWNRRYCLSPDGKRFLMMREVTDREDRKKIALVLNWSSELERLIPASR